MYTLIGQSDIFAITGSLFQYYTEKPTSDNNRAIADFTNGNTTDSFKFKEN